MLVPCKQNLQFIIVIILVLVFPLSALAAEVPFPVTAYSAEDLSKVREWEKIWAGKKIDKNNIDQVAEFLPESYVQAYKEPERWGAPPDDYYFNIIPYKQYIETPGMISATKMYAPQVKMNAESWIENYADIAGMPFPNPKTGIEVAWNFDFNTHGDSNHYARKGPVITPGVSIERTTHQEQWELYWIHRVDVEPLPKYVKNKKGIHRGLFLHLYEPAESQNSRFFNLRYIDPKKSDDGYMYYAPFRRIRRIAVGQRTDSVDGSDMIYDDEFGWDGHILRNTYEHKGKQEMLCSRQTDIMKLKRQKGQSIPNNLNRERISTLKIEVKSKDPNYLYSKRIWYVDPESYYIVWEELYDDLNRFWKCFEILTTDFKTEKGETKKMINGTIMIDFQRTHSSLPLHEIYEVGLKKVDKKMFSIQNLQKTY